MAEFYSFGHGRDGADNSATVRTGRQSKARSEQETVSGFKREKRLFSALQSRLLGLFSTANGLSGGSADCTGGSKVTPALRG